MTHLSGGSHIGAILSVADIMAVLYADVLKIDPENPKSPDRDRFILSKGHAGASVYAALAENGFFPVEELKTHYQNGSRLSGHVSHHLPGVDFSTGSLGHGLSAATGMAYAAKKDKKSHKVYVVLGDGECDEGSVWEAALFANHNELGNLVAIIDHNKMQSMVMFVFTKNQIAIKFIISILMVFSVFLFSFEISKSFKISKKSVFAQTYSIFILSWPCQLVIEIVLERLLNTSFYIIFPAMLIAGVFIPIVIIKSISWLEGKTNTKFLSLMIGSD